MRSIDVDELKNAKFLSPQVKVVGGRHGGKLKEQIIRAYQKGWNDCIDAIIDNAPTVAVTDYDTGYQDGLEAGLNDIRTKGEWIDSGVSAEGIRVFRCSVCRREIASNCLPQDRSTKYPFCNCGAKMGGEEP